MSTEIDQKGQKNILSEAMLRCKSIYHIYRGRAERASVVALKGVSFDIQEGEFVSIVGPSGSGKSSLLEIVGGLMRPTAGTVYFDGLDITHTPEEDLVNYRREKIGFVFQEGNLLPDLSAIDNIIQSLAVNGVEYGFRKKRAIELLDLMGVSHRKNQLATRLSGGERQRVAIARAMANQPRLIIADEPTGNVDFATSVRLLELFKELNRETGMAFMVATHSTFVAKYADRSLELRDGLLLGQHAEGVDLMKLDMSRMVVMDSDHRISLPENVVNQLNDFSSLWDVKVIDGSRILLSPLESLAEKDIQVTVEPADQKECPVCGIFNPINALFCSSCGTKF
ncbi:MAG: ATP-binding cassette domain-containing protein [Candidatus Thorarchaeota archaeon]